MKLTTNIKPRRDGAVLFKSADGTSYTFAPDESGRLVGEVDDEAVAVQLLDTGSFFPVDDDDFSAAVAVANAAGLEGDGDEGEAQPDDEGDVHAAPVEAATPPAPAHGRGHRKTSQAK